MAIAARRPYRGVTCPYCENGVSGQACSCGRPFEIVRFEPVEPRAEGSSLALAGPSEGTPCSRHAGNRAESACERCGQFMCGLCRIDTDGKSWCPPCFERMSAEGSLPGAARRFRNYARLAAACFVLSFFLPAAGLGLFYAIRGLRDKRARKEPDGLVELYVWVVLCSLFVLAWIGAILLIVLAMTGVFDS